MVLVLAIQCQRAQISLSRNPYLKLHFFIQKILLYMNLSPILVTKLTLPIIIQKNICTSLLQINPLLKRKAVQLLTNTMQMKTDHTKITIS